MEALQVLGDRYQLLSTIRKGGFGIIYKGHDSLLGKDIAIKEIKPDLLEDVWFVDQFQKEARHVAKMNHQNIVHIFDLVQSDDNKFYIIMEYIDGLDLNRLIQETQKRGESIPLHLGIHVIAEVCKALDYAHNCSTSDSNEPLNLVHQDISPSNIMISKTGIVKLIDFGIAGVQKTAVAEKNQVSLKGKLPYMSPEHLNGKAHLDRRSDIFSLGLVLYEVLEGKRFFQNLDSQQIIETLRNGKLKLKDLKATPQRLQDVLHKALEKSPENRYQNVNQFYIDLATYLASNADTTVIDSEMGNFVSRMVNQPGLPIDDVPKDIRGPEVQNKKSGSLPKIEDFVNDVDFVADRVEKSSGTNVTSGDPGETSIEFSEIGDEIKTVIDAVRLSTRGHKKLIIRSLIAMASAALLFLSLDTLLQGTRLGSGIYDTFFPPTIKITSVPSGAKVYLNNALLTGKTPLAIDHIKPGVYELRLVADGFKPIIKSLQVPNKGDVEIRGERTRSGSQPYLFRFKTTLEITSHPQDAEVYINNIKYGQNTPCSITWEVGEPFEIELRKPGYNHLVGFSLETKRMLEQIDDKRSWQFEVTKEPNIGAKIVGLFGKFCTFESNPPDATVYLDDNPNPIATTARPNNIFLTAAPHKIVFAKKGYNRKIVNLVVNESTPKEILVNLSRPVRFMAYDAKNGKSEDLGATITKIVRKGKTVIRGKRTPSEINLLPFNYEAYFSKNGYRDTKVKVSARDRLVTAKMEPLNAQFSVVILDKQTGGPLSNVEVRVRSLDDPSNSEVVLDITDAEGTCGGSLSPGLYVFRTSKSGFNYQEETVMIQLKGLNLIEFNLEKRP